MKPNRPNLGRWILAHLGLALAISSNVHAADSASLEFFETKIRPVLVEHCQKCHGAEKQKGGLRLDSRSAILEGGDTGAAAIAGKPDESLLIEVIQYSGGVQMPPKSKLAKEDVEALTKWVAMGLPWTEVQGAVATKAKPGFDLKARKEAHWSWGPLKVPAVPAVKQADWPLDPIDAFILAKLEANQIQPAVEAEKRALIRRANYDLIGLPPTVEEVDAFLTDTSPKAFETIVDRLLASPKFGERWARHWLDLVRYGETRGHEFDPAIPNAYQYRDYVIRALNADLPYDRFVTEHLAGDLLPAPRIDPKTGVNESILGTGFWFLGEEVHSPVDISQDEADRFDNRIDVMSKTFLGLTVACARCHDHKFDAISQRDYYALSGFLASSGYRQARFATQGVEKGIADDFERLGGEAEKALSPLIAQALAPAIDGLDKSLISARQAILDPKNDAPEAIRPWVAELRDAKNKPNHPLHVFTLSAFDEAASGDSQAFKTWLRNRFASAPPWKDDTTTNAPALGRVIADFRQPGPIAKLQDGFSFGLRTRQAGELVFESSAGGESMVRVQTLSSARQEPSWLNQTNHDTNVHDYGKLGTWDRSGKTLRSPEFRFDTGRIWFLVNGPGHAYVSINSHLMVAGPLHRNTLIDWADDPRGWHWVLQDLSDYKGHRAHIELTSDGKKPLSVALIVDSANEPAPLFDRPNQRLNEALANPLVDSPDALARAYQGVVKEAVSRLGSDTIATKPDSEDYARVAYWVVSSPQLFLAVESDQRVKLKAEIARLGGVHEAIAARIPKTVPTAPAMFEGTSFDESLLIRGSAKSPGAVVPRRFLEAIAGDKAIIDPIGGSGRLELASQIVSPTNPYISRVIVNRVWHHLFGRGIVASTDNFGVLGEKPTHPELLDFLAERFMNEGWSIKALIRRVMLTRTYQMSSRPEPAFDAIDPNNLLLHRMSVKRLQSEPIRDTILSVSGRLNETMYGPSVPVHLTAFMDGRGRPAGSGPVDGDGRRGLYIEIRRNFLSPMMLAFDSPIPASTIGRRNVSNVPAQALILMNDPFVVEQAALWADRILKEPNRSANERIEKLYKMAFSRPVSPQEADLAVRFLEEQGRAYQVDGEAWKNDRRPWADLCHVLINSKEFIFID